MAGVYGQTRRGLQEHVSFTIRDDYPNAYGLSVFFNSTAYRFSPRDSMRTKNDVMFKLKSRNKLADTRRLWTMDGIKDVLKSTDVGSFNFKHL
ncbi:Hypothetical predicted protein [Mytilus galloprovincialis]|uniref:Uncharacterized protein n=1 Tax=Mytilus galloprovincialis TaxID=29158 RepID=A0A8B6EX52_MYTGA|nr:Hypothetical predicted protein [Mytilus galloprovincialis]